MSARNVQSQTVKLESAVRLLRDSDNETAELLVNEMADAGSVSGRRWPA